MPDPVDSARKSLESTVKDFAIDGKSPEEAARFVAAQLPSVFLYSGERGARPGGGGSGPLSEPLIFLHKIVHTPISMGIGYFVYLEDHE